ncbi:MAG: exopolysaccharide biosynthesis polyprenyl glycosylphosphotransferase [Saprospiraceae bacterium]|jgi:exopolysaccharide biosynthesis polyprenyl glycosylphosphotransferase
MNRKVLAAKYLFADYFSSVVAWLTFFLFRKTFIEKQHNFELVQLKSDEQFWYGIVIIPVFWVVCYGMAGFYHKVYRKSRLTEFITTFYVCLVGSLLIFFALLLDDNLNHDYKAYYKSLMALMSFQFILNYLPKFFITSSVTHKIHNKKYGFNAIIIGQSEKALKLYNELENSKRSAGYFFKGYLSVKSSVNESLASSPLSKLGNIENLLEVIQKHEIKEVVIATDKRELESINKLISDLQTCDVNIKIIPDMHNILTGQVKMNSIMHAALIEIDFDSTPHWQKVSKRCFDIFLSSFFLVLLSPVYLTLAILVKSESNGPIFFRQERIGKKGKPFFIIKFRSMYTDAETQGPQLSKDNDSRITSIGRILRKTRMDEIPQFYNVLKGEMSIVGPRPERIYFINLIYEKAPQYKFLYKIKPGITSWGQVKFGYAENVDEMIERLKFDLIYLENRSFLVDVKILIYTALVILQGKGK